MALRAIKDTFVFEDIGGTRVRRRVREGQLVSPLYEADSADVEEVPDAESRVSKVVATTPKKRAAKRTPPALEPAQNPATQGSGRLSEEAGKR
jgi:chemotaxis regulatin CheY-phosphate phosphatase CheZ